MTEHLDKIEAYRNIDTAIAVGKIPLSTCLEIAAPYKSAASLDPGTAYDLAWLQLETGLAMMREPDPATKKPHLPKQINANLEQARAGFRRVTRSEDAPLYLQGRAIAAVAGVGRYQEAVTGAPAGYITKQHIPYLKTLQ